jgi:hypothetical protein
MREEIRDELSFDHYLAIKIKIDHYNEVVKLLLSPETTRGFFKKNRIYKE